MAIIIFFDKMLNNVEQTLFTTSSAVQPRTVNISSQNKNISHKQGPMMRAGVPSVASNGRSVMKAQLGANMNAKSDISMSLGQQKSVG